MQIVASKLRKGVEYFNVVWKGIIDQGSTWEPITHLRGDPAKVALGAFRQARALEQASEESKKVAKARRKIYL